MPRLWSALAVCGVLAMVLTSAPAAWGHAEREAAFPSGSGEVPTYRSDGPVLVVCKPDSARRIAALPSALRVRNEGLLEQCAYRHLQEAIDAVAEQGSRVVVLPGVYREEPSLAIHRSYEAGEGRDTACQELFDREPEREQRGGAPIYSYEEQRACPHVQNLIGIFGDTDDDGVCDGPLCRLQIEGTGARPEDVIVDGTYGLLNGIRADRADGLYLRNLTVQRFEFNSIYVLETDGFAFDSVVTRWNDEYGWLSFAVDHGLYENCEGYGNGDSSIYPGSASDLYGDLPQGEEALFENIDELRFATEIRACRGHHSTLGYSGTAGNAVWTHHNEFDHNAAGMAMDSFFPYHPGLPQDHALVEDNLFHSNNNNYYARYVQTGRCDDDMRARGYEDGVVCPVVPVPVGTGALVAGGNHNLFRANRFYDNWRQGQWQFFVPAFLRGENDPDRQFDTSNWNTYTANQMGANPAGLAQPNGYDFVWDGEGEGNCWATDNTSATGEVRTAYDFDGPPAPFPDCDPRPPFTPGPEVAAHTPCAEYSRTQMPDPPGCRWFDSPDVPDGRQPDTATIERLGGADRIETAILAAREGFPTRAPAVVLARADLYADALAGAPLAAAVGGPLLLTGSDGLDARVRAELDRLGATRVILLGGDAALSPGVVEDVVGAGIDDVHRIAGANRFATAVRIAEHVGGAHAFLAKGIDSDERRAWADALSASAAGAVLERPVLLTGGDDLPSETAALLAQGAITDVEIVGGPAAISEAVEAEVGRQVEDVSRLAGADRYATSAAVAAYVVEVRGDPTELWLATGSNWPDGIAAGAAVAVDEGVLLLVDDLDEGSVARRWLDGHEAVLENVRVLGGTAAVPEAVVDAITGRYGEVGDVRGDRSHGARTAIGNFRPLSGAPSAYATVRGHALLERRLDGTTRTRVWLEGLPTAAGTVHPTHVHASRCGSADNPHYRFDPEGAASEPSEIHPTVVTDRFGTGTGDSTVMHRAGEDVRSGLDAASIVIHAPDGEMVLCADLR